ncbi:putative tubby-like protein [Dioscorea sansibarensis]
MGRVHPDNIGKLTGKGSDHETVWTVWKKSSMAFHGTDGFSVYDYSGKLTFRVDNYSRRHKLLSGDLLLMDGSGSPLLSLHPQIFSMYDKWNGYKSEDGLTTEVFSMGRRSIMQSSDEAQVFMLNSTGPGHAAAKPDYKIEGCFWRRRCNILTGTGVVIAEISRKKAKNTSVFLGDDVFTIVIKAGVDCELIMAFIVVMDRISCKPFGTRILCSSSSHAVL